MENLFRMLVFKFGGASVKDADAVRNVVNILKLHGGEQCFVIISAMGKTTNHLERVLNHYWNNEEEAYLNEVEALRTFHLNIMNELFDETHDVFDVVENIFDQLISKSKRPVSDAYGFEYDQIVSLGEVLSTKIITAYIQKDGIDALWLDARKLIRTDHHYREASVDWGKTQDLLESKVSNNKAQVYISQGFLGHTAEGFTTTLGREGSDFSAAIVAYILESDRVTIWKDVPGMLNADPKWFSETIRLPQISFKEAIELSYYGASVIHPKTIKPLQNKNIPLYVRSFKNPEQEGTVISEDTTKDHDVPSYIFKMNQVLISITPKDFSFIAEDNLSEIFQIFHRNNCRINLMQNSAIDFSVSIDKKPEYFKGLISELKNLYHVRYNEGLELLTIRHYDEPTVLKVTEKKKILVEQRSRVTARMVMLDQSAN